MERLRRDDGIRHDEGAAHAEVAGKPADRGERPRARDDAGRHIEVRDHGAIPPCGGRDRPHPSIGAYVSGAGGANKDLCEAGSRGAIAQRIGFIDGPPIDPLMRALV